MVPVRHDITTPTATWTITHGLGREPIVTVHLPSGEMVSTDVHVDDTYIVVTLPSPMTGFVMVA